MPDHDAIAQEKSLMLLIMRHKRMIEAYAYAIIPDFHIVEDVFQEVACFAVERQDELPAEAESLAAWLRQVTRFKALEARRGTQRMPRLLDEDALIAIAPAFTPADATFGADSDPRDSLTRCLEGLGGRARQVLEARYRDRLSCEEIAARSAWTVQSVYAVLKRAKAALLDCTERRVAAERG